MTGRLAGLDVGDKRIGVAVSDALGLTAQGLGVVVRRSREADVRAIFDLLEGYDVVGFVAGLPLHLDGSDSVQADRVRHFCRTLEESSGLRVDYFDERFTSVESERLLISSGMRREKRKRVRDQVAATLILQSYLDAKRSAARP